MTSRAIPAATTLAQHTASSPGVSAWVAANAGSGKTHVLAQRVLRLLLQGTPPGKILCLTFTKAAAANMATRIFETLAQWAVLPEADLRRAIAATGADSPAASDLVFARRLFARTIETPGGLKIQTIHAFCERLLHLFPFEANVAAGFEVIEAARQADLMAQARTATLEAAIRNEDELAQHLQALAGLTTPGGFETLLHETLKHRADLSARAAEPPGEALARHFGLQPHETPAEIDRALLHDGIAPPRWAKLGDLFAQGSSNDQKQAARLAEAQAALASSDTATAIDHYVSVFFTTAGTPRVTIATNAIRKISPKAVPLLEAEAVRLAGLHEKRKAAATVARSTALIALAVAVFARYAGLKAERGLIDFDDLITRTKNLFDRSDAAWILFKLDAGIDHILIDEAQDTSEAQWDILKKLASDFTSGEGARAMPRSFFAVGDEKQSIYSFQGAAPQMFAQMRRFFGQRIKAAQQRFHEVELNLSFRSAPEILRAVDRVFANPANYQGLSAENDDKHTIHEARKTDVRGHVEIWPPIEADATDPPPDWRMPLDAPDPNEPASRLAKRIARTIAEMIAPGSPQRVNAGAPGQLRPITAGDIMILVRSRNSFFEAAIRALKDHGVPVAGADRMVLTNHIAVMDLIAAGRCALLPQDDLALANVLKSPLIRLDDDDLLEIAPDRAGSLLEALEGATAPGHRAAAHKLRDWRERARNMTPFGFYTRLLGADQGRHALLARLGLEAGDAIDEFVSLALAHERDDAPSLATFLGQLEAAGLEIKRDMEAAGGSVRVMTVHGAKGLEAKVVFLPDTCGRPGGPGDPLVFRLEAGEGEPGLLAWSPRRSADPPQVAEARETLRELAQDEHRRLLYVAMTRAEERLYVAGFCGTNGKAQGCWHEMIHDAHLNELESVPAPWDATEMVLRSGAPPVGTPAQAAPADVASPLPPWLRQSAPPEAAAPPPLRPSHALAAADQFAPADPLAYLAQKAARQRGQLLHVLLQYLPGLPVAQRQAAAEHFLAQQPGGGGSDVLARALRVLDDPDLAPLFGPDSQAEVAIAGHIAHANGTRIAIAGQIDRLAVSGSDVFIADYKTGRPRALADTPFSYVTQLALYRAIVAPLYPGHHVRALLVWTAGPQAVEIDAARLDAAVEMVRHG